MINKFPWLLLVVGILVIFFIYSSVHVKLRILDIASLSYLLLSECEKLLEKFDDEVDDVWDDDDINRQQASAHVIFSHIFVLLDFVFVQRLQNKCTLQCLAFSPSIETDTLGAFS